MKDRMISVITVSKNAEKTIEKAIVSVLNQTYESIEYIFIDGRSSDRTNKIILSYRERLENRGILFKHISEPDNGIFDAMNKGVSVCNGEWVYFINADDEIYDKYVFEKVISKVKSDDIGCIYGNIVQTFDHKKILRKGSPIETIYYKYPICHQAAFVRTSLAKQYKFDDKYERLADFMQFFNMYLDGIRFEYIDLNIAYFALSGVSQKNNFTLAMERERIHRKLGIDKKKRLIRWGRYLCICAIKDNKILHRSFLSLNVLLQSLVKNSK